MTRRSASIITTRIVLIAMLLMVLPENALADGGSGGYEATANGYHITLEFPEPIKTGVNGLHVLITDSMGMPVSNAIVQVVAVPSEGISDHKDGSTDDTHGTELAEETPIPEDAHGMTGMDMSSDTEANPREDAEGASHEEETAAATLAGGHEAGEYSGEIHFDASGDYLLGIHFTVGDQMTEVEIPIEVPRSVSNSGILAAFFGINATVVAAAAITRRRSVSPKA